MPSSIYHERLDGQNSNYPRFSVRILTIPASSTEGETRDNAAVLELGMRVVDLDWLTPPDCYEALSYRWDDHKSTKKTLVNGCEFPVGENLRLALEHLQLSTRPRNIWADAICINQSKTEKKERTHQMKMMHQIYKKASRGIIWLGPEENDSTTALSRLEMLAELYQLVLLEAPVTTWEMIMPETIQVWDQERYHDVIIELRESFAAALKSVEFTMEWLPPLIHLLQRSWWGRAWVRQELTLSTNPQILCGHKLVDWEDVAAGLKLLLLVGEFPGGVSAVSRPTEMTSLMDKFLAKGTKHALPLIQFRDRYHFLKGRVSFKVVVERLIILNHAESKYAEDRILSLLGLPSDLFPNDIYGPRIDFSDNTTAEEIFTMATKALIEACWNEPTNMLRILAFVRPESNPGLPSWVPDWSMGFENNIIDKFHVNIFFANNCNYNPNQPLRLPRALSPSTFGRPALDIFGPGSVLKVLGPNFDRVYAVGKPIDDYLVETGRDFGAAVRLWLVKGAQFFETAGFGSLKTTTLDLRTTNVDEAHLQQLLHNGIPGTEKHRDAIAHAFIFGRGVRVAAPEYCYRFPRDSEPRRAGSREKSMFHTVLHGSQYVPEDFLANERGNISQDERASRFCQPYIDAAGKASSGRRPVVSEKGLIGLVPAGTRVGDKLVVLLGAPVPFVLRSDGIYHRIVGSCYVHGAMDGEMVAGSPHPVELFQLK